MGSPEGNSFSSTIHRIAVGSIALGLAILIISFLILMGFQGTIKNKIYSFSSHFLITRYEFGGTVEEPPMNINTNLYNNYNQFESIKHVQEYAHKAALIKTPDEILGVVLKGVGTTFDTVSWNQFIVEGRFIQFTDSSYSQEILVSRVIANKLKLTVGDKVLLHFFQDPPRSRNLTIVGIYETNLSEYFDEKVVLGDIGLIRRLNGWNNTTAGGLEVFVNDEKNIAFAELVLSGVTEYDQAIQRVSDKYIQVFEWLELISRQVNIFLVIILLVVCVNMISILLILIMERTNMIGTLKALGAKDALIRKVFSFTGVRLVLKGMLLGNILGLGFCFIQDQFRVITLNPVEYYVSYVPIGWDYGVVLLLNLLTFGVVSVVLFLPTAIISGIRPIQAIKFD